MFRKFSLCLVAAALFLAMMPASAAPITLSGSSGDLSASVSFELLNSTLQITLVNSATADVLFPTGVLTGVYFELEGDPVLTPVSATVGSGSTVLFPPAGAAGSDVSTEWAYRSGLAVPGRTLTYYGISSAGLGLFGPGDRFSTAGYLWWPASPNGLDYGITSAGDNPLTGNTPVTGKDPLIKNSVVFTFGTPAGFTLGSVSSVWFQYGTSLSDPQIDAIPEPASWFFVAPFLICAALRKLIALSGR